MSEWTKVVTQPVGLVGFVLFLVFGYLAKIKRQDERRWVSPAAMIFAAVALIGGLGLAYLQIPKPQPSTSAVQKGHSPAPKQQQTNTVKQSSSGNGSPNVQGVQGDVTITVDQSTGNTKIEAPAERPKRASD